MKYRSVQHSSILCLSLKFSYLLQFCYVYIYIYVTRSDWIRTNDYQGLPEGQLKAHNQHQSGKTFCKLFLKYIVETTIFNTFMLSFLKFFSLNFYQKISFFRQHSNDGVRPHRLLLVYINFINFYIFCKLKLSLRLSFIGSVINPDRSLK